MTKRLIRTRVAGRNARHAGNNVRQGICRCPGGLSLASGLALPRAARRVVRGGRLCGESLLLGESGWGGWSRTKNADRTAQQDHDGDEGERLLFGWSWHGAQDERRSRFAIITALQPEPVRRIPLAAKFPITGPSAVRAPRRPQSGSSSPICAPWCPASCDGSSAMRGPAHPADRTRSRGRQSPGTPSR